MINHFSLIHLLFCLLLLLPHMSVTDHPSTVPSGWPITPRTPILALALEAVLKLYINPTFRFGSSGQKIPSSYSRTSPGTCFTSTQPSSILMSLLGNFEGQTCGAKSKDRPTYPSPPALSSCSLIPLVSSGSAVWSKPSSLNKFSPPPPSQLFQFAELLTSSR